MSIVNLFVAARNAWSERRRRDRTYAELMSLDDRSLADIGIHRSQLSAAVDSMFARNAAAATPPAPDFDARPAHLAGHRWLPRA